MSKWQPYNIFLCLHASQSDLVIPPPRRNVCTKFSVKFKFGSAWWCLEVVCTQCVCQFCSHVLLNERLKLCNTHWFVFWKRTIVFLVFKYVAWSIWVVACKLFVCSFAATSSLPKVLILIGFYGRNDIIFGLWLGSSSKYANLTSAACIVYLIADG